MQLKLLISIETPYLIHWKPEKKSVCSWGKIWANRFGKSKETGIINRFFDILYGECLLKLKVVVVQTPEKKFKADIARNVTFE